MRLTPKKVAGLAVVLLTVSAAMTGVAVADNTVPDGDDTTPVAAHPLAFGTVCINSSTDEHALVAVSRNGSATGTNTFRNGATVSVSVLSVSGTGLGAAMDASAITLPSNWATLSNNTLSDAVSSKVTLDAGATAGSFSGSVTYRATGVNAGGSTINRDAAMSVSATVSDTGSCAPAPLDTTSPTVTVSVPAPVSGSNGWFNADDITPVVGTVTASDVSGVADISCTGAAVSDVTGYGTNTASGTLTVSGDGTHAVSCTATDGASPANTGAADGSVNTATIDIDTLAPVVTDEGFSSGTAGDNGWYISAVTEAFAAEDASSGLADCTANFTQTSAAEGSAVTIPSGSCSDLAGNVNAGIASAPYEIDLTDPNLTCAAAPRFLLNQPVATVAATVTDSTSGPAASPVTAAANTTTVGSESVSVTGYDVAGRSSTVSCSYSVVYDWAGFFQPVNNPTDAAPWNSAKAGRSIPVKFNLGGNQGANILLAGYPKITAMQCPTSTVAVDPIETYTSTAGGSSLTYDSTAQQYVYVWKSDKAWAGKCFVFSLGLNDGTMHTFQVQFTK